MIDNTQLQAQQVMGALGYPMALPQRVEPVTNTTTTRQRVNYDPKKLQALMSALGRPTPIKSRGEIIAESLAALPETRSFTGGFGEEIINPWDMGLNAFARSFGNVYKSRKESEREAQAKDLENQIKAAQLDAEASKENVQNTTENTYMKVNDPNAKQYQEAMDKINSLNTLNMMNNQLEDIGTRFDDDFKNIDDMQQNSTRFGRSSIGGLFGAGVTKEEKLARDEFDAWKGSIKNILVNANRQAGSGSMSDADAARYEQGIGQAKTPAEARNIMRSFYSRLSMTPVQGQEKAQEMSDIDKWMQGVK